MKVVKTITKKSENHVLIVKPSKLISIAEWSVNGREKIVPYKKAHFITVIGEYFFMIGLMIIR